MTANLQHWRKENGLTQVDAANLLGVSQAYLSLLEKGARPLTAEIRGRVNAVRYADGVDSADRYRAQLSALGYPRFSHVKPSRPRSSPDSLLLSILSGTNVDARVVEALPWLVRRYVDQLNLVWLVRQAKLRNLQNRLGFVLQAASVDRPEFSAAVRELERARLLEEATLCWDSMPAATRGWLRTHRSPLAQHWNILTKLQTEDANNAA